MSNATSVTVASFGVVAGLAGIGHGIGEILQGNLAPDGIVIMSWPDVALFRIVNGEPAMTIVPNLRITGILAIVVSLIFSVWTTWFIQRKHDGLILLLLSLVLLLVGGGFGPPLLGIILGTAATKINAPLAWWRAHLSRDSRNFLAGLWPLSFMFAFIAWLLVMPGSLLLDYFVGLNNPDLLISTLTLSAFALLLLTIVTGFAHDLQRQIGVQLRPALSG